MEFLHARLTMTYRAKVKCGRKVQCYICEFFCYSVLVSCMEENTTTWNDSSIIIDTSMCQRCVA